MERNKFTAATAILVLTLGAGCAERVSFRNSAVVPAAEATAKIKTDDNGNAVIRLRVVHLAPPDRLVPPKSVYVVWAETPQGRTINLGQLTVDSDLEADFTGVTPLTKFRLIITAEDLATAGSPGRQVVLSTEMFEP